MSYYMKKGHAKLAKARGGSLLGMVVITAVVRKGYRIRSKGKTVIAPVRPAQPSRDTV